MDMRDKLHRHRDELRHELEQLLDMEPSPRVEAALAPVIERWNALNKACHHMGGEYEDRALTETDLHSWLAGMVNADGTHGPHWTEAQTTSVGDGMGIDWSKVSPKCWNVAMNMMYSDYSGVGEKYKATGPDFYAALAQAFLMDPDGGKPREKLAGYFYGVVKPQEK